MGLGSRGGKRIRVNMYQLNNCSEIVIGADLLDKQLSTTDRLVWTAIYRGKPQRPSQAVKCFVFWAMSNKYIDYKEPAAYTLEYWGKDMNLRKLNSQA